MEKSNCAEKSLKKSMRGRVGRPEGPKILNHVSEDLLLKVLFKYTKDSPEEKEKFSQNTLRKICLECHIEDDETNRRRLRYLLSSKHKIVQKLTQMHEEWKAEVAKATEATESLTQNMEVINAEDEVLLVDVKEEPYELQYSEAVVVSNIEYSDNLRQPCEWIDICVQYAEERNDKYIRLMTLPLAVVLFTDDQFNLIHRNMGSVLHLSVTTSMIPNISCHDHASNPSSSLLYYLGMVEGSGGNLPVVEILCEANDPTTIGSQLSFYLSHFENFPFSRIVADLNTPLLHGILRALRFGTFIEYINKCFTNDPDLIPIYICHNDFLKSITMTMKEHRIPGTSSKLILEAFIALANSTQVKEFDAIFVALIYVTCSEFFNEETHKYSTVLKEFIRKSPSFESVEFNPESTNSHRTGNFCSIPFHDSEYYKKYNAILSSILDQIEKMQQTIEENPMYCLGFIKSVTFLYMPYACFWSKIAHTHSKSVGSQSQMTK